MSIDPIVRKFPPLGFNEVVKGTLKNRDLFADEEIHGISKVIAKKKMSSNSDIYAYQSEHGKSIIQQQFKRGSGIAAVSMLIMDKKKAPKIEDLRKRNLFSTEDMMHYIAKTKLASISKAIPIKRRLSYLREEIKKDGAAILGINDSSMRHHYIIIDEISEDRQSVRLRDPHHRWEITVKGKAIRRRLEPGQIVQILNFPRERE